MHKSIFVFTVDYFPYAGGAEIAAREIAKRLPDFDFTIITARNSRKLPRSERLAEGTLVRVGLGFRQLDKLLFPFLGAFAGMRLARHARCDIAWGIMGIGGIPAFIFSRIMPNIPYILSVQEGDVALHYDKRGSWWWRPIYRFVHRAAHRLHVISPHLIARVRNYGYRGDIAVIPNGMDPVRFSGVPRIASSPFRVVTISRLVSTTGIDDLIVACAIVRARRPDIDFELHIIGDGPLRHALESLARKHPLLRVVFHGHVPHPKVHSYLAHAALFIRPSRFEAFGNAFLEAMACAVPVIGTPVGGIHDFLKDGETGLMCLPDDPASCAACIERLLSDSPLRLRIARAGQTLARTAYGWDALAERYRRELFSPLARPRSVLIITALSESAIGGPATSVPLLAEGLAEHGCRTEIIRPDHTKPFLLRYIDFAWRIFRRARAHDLVFAQDIALSGFPAALASCVARKPFSVKVVGDFAWEYGRNAGIISCTIDAFQSARFPDPRLGALRLIQRFVARRACRIIVPSQYLRNLVAQWVRDPEKIAVVPNAIRPFVPEGGRIRDSQLIFSAGRFVSWKRFDSLIRAFAEVAPFYPDARLVIAGDGPLRSELRSLAESSGFGRRIMFPGILDARAMASYYSAAGCFVLPSEYEGFPHVLLEAMAHGTPVVASDAGGNPEIVHHGVNGLLFPPLGDAPLRDALIAVLGGTASLSIGNGSLSHVPRETAETMLIALSCAS